MALSIEFCSLVIPRDAAASMPGGLHAFEILCADLNAQVDDALVRISAMSTIELSEVVERMRRAGIPDTWMGGPSTAVLDLRSTAETIPPWLCLGTVGGHVCVWAKAAGPGPVVGRFRTLMMKLPLTPRSTLVSGLAEHEIQVVSSDTSGSVDFVRGANSIPGILVSQDDHAVLGIATFVPPLRFGTAGQLTTLLDDIDAVVARLGANAAG